MLQMILISICSLKVGSPAQLGPAHWSDDVAMRSKTVKVDQGDINRYGKDYDTTFRYSNLSPGQIWCATLKNGHFRGPAHLSRAPKNFENGSKMLLWPKSNDPCCKIGDLLSNSLKLAMKIVIF